MSEYLCLTAHLEAQGWICLGGLGFRALASGGLGFRVWGIGGFGCTVALQWPGRRFAGLMQKGVGLRAYGFGGLGVRVLRVYGFWFWGFGG